MSNVSLNLYRIFCVVAQSKNYAEASEKLNKYQKIREYIRYKII